MTIDEAFRVTDRQGFLPNEVRWRADQDAPVPIGYGQTNSQPSTVRRMLEWLTVRPGERVLDVGAGSGWTTALLSRLVGDTGYVYATEKIPELVSFGRSNCQRIGLNNVRFVAAGSTLGLPASAPYHRILVSASADRLPVELIEQLKPDGRLVVPVGHSIHVIERTEDGYNDSRHDGFIFVPLV